MNKVLKTALTTGAFLLIVVLGLIIWKSNRASRAQQTCAGLNVTYKESYAFVTQSDIENYLATDYGAYIGQRLDSLNLDKIEKILDSKSAVLKSEAFITPDGMLNVRISQRAPVVRFQKGKFGFYADERGFIFPLQSNYTSKVPIIDGAIPLDISSGYKGEPKTDDEKEWLRKAISLVEYISSSKTWSGNISQINVDEGGDIILVPSAGREKFILGEPDDINDKFERIGKYYTTIRPAKGENTYKSVNVKYDGQIVCRK